MKYFIPINSIDYQESHHNYEENESLICFM